MGVVYQAETMVTSTKAELAGKQLFQTWKQFDDGLMAHVNRYMSQKMKVATGTHVENSKILDAAKKAVLEQCAYLQDSHFRIVPNQLPNVDMMSRSKLIVGKMAFREHRCVVEPS